MAFERDMPKRIFMTLLYTRMNKLFKKLNSDQTDVLNLIKPFDFLVLNGIGDFSYSKEAYAFCNSVLTRSNGGIYVFDIYQVREEISQIESSIRSREEIGDLINGL